MAYGFYPQFNPFGSLQSAVMQQPVQSQPQILRVQSEEQARQYPVAVGNSVTFIDENKPYCYTKSMGFPQLEPPVFEKYRLVKEDSSQTLQNEPEGASKSQGIDLSCYALKADVDACRTLYDDISTEVKAEIEKLKSQIENLKGGVLNE